MPPVESLTCVWLFAIPWTAAHHVLLFSIISWSCLTLCWNKRYDSTLNDTIFLTQGLNLLLVSSALAGGFFASWTTWIQITWFTVTYYLPIGAFELWCWRRRLRVPWTARRTNQSILKKISPEYSLEGLVLWLKFQYFGHLMWRADSLEKTLMLGKTEGRRRRDDRGQNGWMASLTQWTWVWESSRKWWRIGKLGVPQSMGPQRVGYDWATEWQWLATNGLQSAGLQRVWHNLAAQQQQQQSLYKNDSKLSAL